MKKYLYILTVPFILTFENNTIIAQDTDSITFEIPPTEIIIDTIGGNLWQIGKPQKPFLNNAHSGINVIITDTINNYPSNDTSSFILIVRNEYTQTCRTCLDFWHKFDMDSLADKGIIDASYDGGNSWILLNDTANEYYFNWNWDFHSSTGNYSIHPIITTGKADGWIQSNFCWIWYFALKTDTIIINPDSLMIRFTFISDSINNNQDGWMIDDFAIFSEPIQNCSSINEKFWRNNITLHPNPCSFQTTIQTDKNFKNSTLTLYNSFGQLMKQIKNISGQTVTLSRDNFPSGLYFIRLTQDNKIISTDKLIITD